MGGSVETRCGRFVNGLDGFDFSKLINPSLRDFTLRNLLNRINRTALFEDVLRQKTCHPVQRWRRSNPVESAVYRYTTSIFVTCGMATAAYAAERSLMFGGWKAHSAVKPTAAPPLPPSAGVAAADAARIVELEAALLVAQTETLRLRARLAEMERFLSDYGLRFRGGEVHNGACSTAPHIDFPLLLFRLRQLSGSVNGREVVFRDGAHQLRACDRLPLRVFANGFILRAGPFVSFGSPSGQAFLDDVLEGYFPSELKEAHPAGVAFDVTDSTGEEWRSAGETAVELPLLGAGVMHTTSASSQAASFAGAGYRLGR